MALLLSSKVSMKAEMAPPAVSISVPGRTPLKRPKASAYCAATS